MSDLHSASHATPAETAPLSPVPSAIPPMPSQTPPPAPTDKTPLATHLVRRGIPLAVLAAFAGGGFLFWHKLDAKPAAVAPPDMGPLPVQVATIARETVPIYPRYLGQTEGSQRVNIHARVAGHLIERSFKEGELVRAGQKLFQIDPRPFEADLAMARAQLESAQATLERARGQLKRYQELSQRQSATPGELEEWQKEERVAAANVQLQKATIASKELQLSYTTVTAPLTGVIGRVLKDVGNYVDAAADGQMAVVQQVDPIYVRFSVTEQDILRRRKQIEDNALQSPPDERMQFQITLSDASVYGHKATVNYRDVQVDQNTGTAIVRGTMANPDGRLRPGMFVYATVQDQALIDVVRVPQKAVLQSPAGASVMVVNDKNVAEMKPIVLGDWSAGDRWIVSKGLAPGDRVIASRLVMVRPGAPVAVVSSGDAPPAAPETAHADPAAAPRASVAE
ncbi:MAG TPA: efflux RND transporter periplasmic adaptor subunit [Tepidisphaeraceae bacterium]|jgi:membrane fusion protein (multidrug efflux system)